MSQFNLFFVSHHSLTRGLCLQAMLWARYLHKVETQLKVNSNTCEICRVDSDPPPRSTPATNTDN
jgi:hypothetical protein